jgi:hypothetical protein
MQVFKEHLMLQNYGKSLSPKHFEIGSLKSNIDAGGNCVTTREKLGPKPFRQFHDLH